MKEFIQFVEDLVEGSYENFLMGLIREKRSVAIFVPWLDEAEADSLRGHRRYAEQLGLSLKYICAAEGAIGENRSFAGLPCLTVEELLQRRGQESLAVLIPGTVWECKFQVFFVQKGIPARCFLQLPVVRGIYTFTMRHLHDIYDAYEMLTPTDESRQVFLASIRARAAMDCSLSIYSPAEQYLLAGYGPEPGQTAIDGGSFDGATALMFQSLGCTVYSFEMDAANYQKGLERARKHGFVLENMGLSDSRRTMHYTPSGTASRVNGKGTASAQLIDIDGYAAEKGIAKVDFIKMDIEGSEAAALRGAMNTISRQKPRLAICTYHKLDDWWKLPQLIRAMRPDYELALRQYPVDGRDDYELDARRKQVLDRYGLDYLLPTFGETVLHCR